MKNNCCAKCLDYEITPRIDATTNSMKIPTCININCDCHKELCSMTTPQKQCREGELANAYYEWRYEEFEKSGEYPTTGECTDWWLSKLKSQNEELVRKIEEMKKGAEEINFEEDNKEAGFNEAIDEVLTIIQSQNYE